MSATAAERFAEFATELELGSVPTEVREAAALHLLDALGCGLAAVALDAAPYAAAAAEGSGPATGIGIAGPLPPGSAALVNGIRCHALDFDDTHPASIAHVSAVLVPAALAAAEDAGADGPALLRALVIGNEVTCRVGRTVGDGFHLRGFHPTAICGAFGATAAVAALHELDAATTVQALGVVGSMAAGLMAYLGDGSATKQLHPGWTAHAAHAAVRLARAGASGPSTVLEGRFGVYEAFTGRAGIDPAEVAGDLGERWETLAIAFKPYANCHFLHAPLDSLYELRAERGLGPEEVESITFVSPAAGIGLVAAPLADKRRPRTPYEAKFSAPFALAAALVHGRSDPAMFGAEHLDDPEILALAARVDYEERDYPTFPASMPGGVLVRRRDGELLERHLAHQRGGSGNPLDAADVVEKYRLNAAGALPADAVETVERTALGLGAGDASPAAFSALAGAARRA